MRVWRLFRRRQRATGPTAESLQGAVLLDNTTVFGARRALDWEPSLPRTLPPGVDLRSLMDVIEAIVLVNDLMVDASSRSFSAFPALQEVSDLSSSFYRDTVVAESLSDGLLEVELFKIAIEKVGNLVGSGALSRELGFLPSMREIEILPTMYQENADFVNLTVNSVSGSLKDEQTIEDLYARLDDFALSLEAIPPALGNFALFAFRGFYYQELAHLLSLSYMPHSWRSNLIRSQLEQPVTRFTDLAVSAGGKIRRDLAAAINAEFATQALSVDFPLIASYVIGQTDSRADLLKTAVEVRNSPKATAFRTWLYETERRIRHEKDLREVRRAQDELNTLVRELEVDFGLRNAPKQEIKFKLGLPVPNGPSIEGPVQLGLPRWVRRAMQRRTHLVFLRELARESVSLPPFLRAYRSLQP